MRTSCDGSHGSIIARGPPFRPSVAAPALGRRQQRRDAPHDEVGGQALGRLAVRAGRQLVGQPERVADADRDVAARMRAASGPAARRRSTRRSRSGTIGAPVRRASTATPSRASWRRAVGAARALREDEQDVALVEDPLGEPERLDVGRAAIDRVDAAVAPPPSRRSASRTAPSCRASGSAGRASGSATRRARPRRGSRRGWRR